MKTQNIKSKTDSGDSPRSYYIDMIHTLDCLPEGSQDYLVKMSKRYHELVESGEILSAENRK
jgi:hypothetical protein